MDLVFDPLLSLWFMLLLLPLFFATVLLLGQGYRDVLLLALPLVFLFFVGFRPSLVSTRLRAPSIPVQVVFENSSSVLNRGMEQRLSHLREELVRIIGEESLTVEPLENRWNRAPSFRDYRRLDRILKPRAPIQLLVGDGRHTVPETALSSLEPAPPFRALLATGSGMDSAVAGLEVNEPLRQIAYSGTASWSVSIQHAEKLSRPRLQLRGGDTVLLRRDLDPGLRDGTLTLESPEVSEGFHYYTLELLENSESTLPQGHPRRTSLGTVVSPSEQKILVSDRYPAWRSAWWGRQLSREKKWRVGYEFRALNRTAPENFNPDLVLYFGFPRTDSAFQQFQNHVHARSAVLFVSGPPLDQARVRETLRAMELEVAGDINPVSEPRRLRLQDAVDEEFPSLNRFRQSLGTLPPLEWALAGVSSGRMWTAMVADGTTILAIHPTKPLGFLNTDRFHRLAMEWGRQGNPGQGPALAGEVLGKLLRQRPLEGQALVRPLWVWAGRETSVRSGSLRKFQIRGPWNQSWDASPIPSVLTFPRPGLYHIKGWREDGTVLSDSLLVMEANRERFPFRPNIVGNLVREDRVFRNRDQLEDWIRSTWKDHFREEQVVWLAWNHPLILLLFVAVLAGGWWVRDGRQ